MGYTVKKKEHQLNIIIRKATINDADDMFALVQAFAASFVPEHDSFDHCLAELVNREDVLLNVAVVDDDIVGYCLGFDHCTFYANGRVSWVEEIMVKSDLRLKGVGRALMTAFEAWASERGSKLVGLATRRAAPFYTALGYEDSAVFFRKLL